MALGTFNPNGYFLTTNNPPELNTRSFSDMILRLFPSGSAPIFALTGKAGRAKAKQVEHGYFIKHMAYAKPVVTAAALATDTTLTVDSVAGLVEGMVFQVPSSRENIRITAVDTAASTITVMRAFGRIAAAAINANEQLIPVGTAYEQGSVRPTPRSIKVQYVPNYTVILRNAWAITDTARASYAEAGFKNIAESKLDCMNFHSTDIETQLLFGQPVAPTPHNGTLIHATQGIIDAIYQYAPSNITTAGATTDYAQLRSLVEPPFLYTSATNGVAAGTMRFVVCDAQAMRVMQDIGRNSGQVQMDQTETTFGMAFTRMRFHKGTLNLYEHPLLTELNPTGGLAIIIDLTSIKLAYMDGRDVKTESYDGSKDSTGNGVDAQGGSLTSEFATEFKTVVTSGVINNLTQGV